VLTGNITIKRVAYLGRFNACAGGLLFSAMFLGNMPTGARAEGAQFDIFAVVANFYFTVLLRRSITIAFVSVQSVSL